MEWGGSAQAKRIQTKGATGFVRNEHRNQAGVASAASIYIMDGAGRGWGESEAWGGV